MNISVAMACYNGEGKILSQLNSLKEQTRKIDEVILIDDHSTDSTPNIIWRFIAENRLQGWNLTINETNTGWKSCFFQAMTATTGDLVFLCDQDDEWDPYKVERMAEIMDTEPQISVLACDYLFYYEPGSIQMRKYKKNKAEKAKPIGQHQFTSRFFMNPSPGCTYAVRKQLIQQTAPSWFPEAPHDEFLWLLATLTGGAWFLNEYLMTIHRYGDNASDIRFKDIPKQQENLRYIQRMLDIMLDYAMQNREKAGDTRISLILEAQTWCKKRARLMETRNPLQWFAMFRYWKYYNSFRNCLSDLYLVLFGSFRRL